MRANDWFWENRLQEYCQVDYTGALIEQLSIKGD